MKIRLFFLLFVLSFNFILASCGHSRPRNEKTSSGCAGTISSSTTIDYSTCSLTEACNLTFKCSTNTQLAQHVQSEPLFALSAFTKKIAQYFDFSSALKAATTGQCAINSITTIGLPSLLQTSPGEVTDTSWFSANSPLDCTETDDASITCQNFAPIADHFTMTGTCTSGGQTADVTVEVTVDASGITPSPAYTSGDFAPYKICGQYGVSSAAEASHYTTEQRMYDCSKRVTNYAAQGNSDGSFTPFVLGTDDPSGFWFLTGCPNDTNPSVNHELCSWLSPEIQPNNPAIANVHSPGPAPINLQCNGGNCDPTSAPLAEGMRLLWSGVLDNINTTINFYEANGSNSSGNATCLRTDGSVGTDCACYNDYNGTCGGSSSGAAYKAFLVMQVTDPSAFAGFQNFCAQQRTANDPSFSGMIANSYQWQVPSNTMLYTLTGGTTVGSSGLCDVGQPSYGSDDVGSCLSTVMYSPAYYGFRAIDAIPSFQTFLWSSSVVGPGSAWVFFGAGDGIVNTRGLSLPVGVRCASSVW